MSNSSNTSSIACYNLQEDKNKFDVLLSFRGEDTGGNFTGHLYDALERKGIYTFKDDVEHASGQYISPESMEVIEASRCSVVVLSEHYASSTWCLTQLVKIVDCMGTWGRVLPIFYHVDPSHVRKQSGCYEEAFVRYEADPKHRVNVESWRDALFKVGNLSGFHVEKNKTDEAKFIQNFAVEISRKIGNPKNYTLEGISGVDSRLIEFELCVSQSSGRVRFIGICGMGGIGKTILAKAYYKRISNEFEDSCSFVEDVGEVCKQENNLVELQNILLSDILKGSATEITNVQIGKNILRKMLCKKKVLIILDDVDKLEQLKALADKEDWFGSGSVIIVTTRDESLVKKAYGNQTPIYRVEPLSESEALELLSWKAFKSTHPSEDRSELCSQVLRYANGLPLALEVLGSILEGLHVNEWESALSRLEEYPNMEILDVLRVSFDGLEEPEKDIFLDIACFFVGWDKDYVIQMLDYCGRHTYVGIRDLVQKSLLIINDDNKLWMHELLQLMGKEIVRKESPMEPGSRSRIWNANDLYHILEEKTGSLGVEAIVTCIEASTTMNFEALSKMKTLRLLMISRSIPPDYDNEIPYHYHLDYLSNELGILEWDYFPYDDLPSSFRPYKLVKLNLTESNIRQICWNNVPTQPALSKMKIIDLSYSRALSKLEDFNVVPNLERLILEGCTKLSQIHTSISTLKWLILLNLKSCTSLENLPPRISGLESLKSLNLYGCSSLSKLPENFEQLKSLEDLDVRRSGIKHVPSFIVPIKNFKTTIDEDIGMDFFSGIDLRSLTTLNLSGRNLSDETVPQCFNHLVSLEYLYLGGNHFSVLPLSINELSKLKVLYLENCKRLISLGPELPSNLEVIVVNHCDLRCDIKFSNDDEWMITKPCPANIVGGSSSHLWLLYVPRHNFPTEWLQPNRDGQFDISFYRLADGYASYGVRFGFRLVYQKDIADLDLITNAEIRYYNELDYNRG
ncbi:hypothetical protein FNV43_RR25219 [Rhamnella rubrinervis]|uniref:TIR domain-containing protein n=1 Tax=Rhamnella rubrinervis TaxID=2594499 RepID=A0A8K0DSR3_9ROSA|nr:hypothetical protein FNV43_RR25219 [Rhamnella rubrinervis]